MLVSSTTRPLPLHAWQAAAAPTDAGPGTSSLGASRDSLRGLLSLVIVQSPVSPHERLKNRGARVGFPGRLWHERVRTALPARTEPVVRTPCFARPFGASPTPVLFAPPSIRGASSFLASISQRLLRNLYIDPGRPPARRSFGHRGSYGRQGVIEQGRQVQDAPRDGAPTAATGAARKHLFQGPSNHTGRGVGIVWGSIDAQISAQLRRRAFVDA
jgi:hypothetical protein